MNTDLIKALHLLVATTLIGLTIASYFYCFINFKNKILNTFVLNKSILADGVIIIPLIILNFILGTKLVVLNHLSFQMGWIQTVYILLSGILIAQILLIITKLNILENNKSFAKKIFHICYGLIFFSYILIIHGAVTQQTLL